MPYATLVIRGGQAKFKGEIRTRPMKRRRGTELARQEPVPEPKWCTRPNPSEPDTQRWGIAERHSLGTSHDGAAAEPPTQLLVGKSMPRSSEQSASQPTRTTGLPGKYWYPL